MNQRIIPSLFIGNIQLARFLLEFGFCSSQNEKTSESITHRTELMEPSNTSSNQSSEELPRELIELGKRIDT